MRKKQKFSTFNDGVLQVCSEIVRETDFSAAKNPSSESQLHFLLKLNYAEMFKRDEDMSFAESRDRSLSLKVKTRLREDVRKTHFVLIGKTLYSIINLDYSRDKREMYFLLEEERVLNE